MRLRRNVCLKYVLASEQAAEKNVKDGMILDEGFRAQRFVLKLVTHLLRLYVLVPQRAGHPLLVGPR